MKKILFVVLALTIMAVPAMASVQNVRVSGDIENTYLVRNSFNLEEGATQDAWIMQTRLRVDADLTDKVMATIALINEREWAADNSDAQDNIDLNLAYVVMKEMLYSPLTVTLGRQEFAFGNSMVIDSAGTNNVGPAASGISTIAEDLTKQTAQDAVRLTFDYDPLTIDAIYSVISQGAVASMTDELADNVLYGVNVGYQFNDERASMVEGYFWVKDGPDKVYMPGVRGSMNVLDGWNLQAEAAYQLGDVVLPAGSTMTENLDRRAYAYQIISNYMLPFEKTEKYEPVFGVTYSVFSGDKTVSGSDGPDDTYTMWDPMYENQAGGKISNTLFNQQNIEVIGASLSFVPMEDVMAEVYYDYLSLNKELSSFALEQPYGTIGTTTTPSQNGVEELGEEIGVVLTYDYTEDVQFGARAGWFFPGEQFTDDAETAEQLILNAKVAF